MVPIMTENGLKIYVFSWPIDVEVTAFFVKPMSTSSEYDTSVTIS